MAKISVLIPVYNGEKYIKSCLSSVIRQSFKDIEIIVINDGSNDDTKNIIEKIALNDERIKIINKKNTGYGDSLNMAILKAKGEYISIVESDDIMKPDMLKTLIAEYFREYDIVKSSFYLLKNKKLVLYDITKGMNKLEIQNVQKTPSIIGIKPSVWSAIYKKKFLIDNNIFFNTSKGASFQDISFQFKAIFLASKIKFVEKPLYLYRIDNPESSINKSDKVFEILDEFQIINDFLSREHVNIKIINQKILFEFLAYIWNYKRIKNIYNEAFIDKIEQIMKNYDIKSFMEDDNIPFKEKIKLNLLIKNKKLFNMFLFLIKNYANKKFYNNI